MARLDDIIEFYAILDRLKSKIGGERTLRSSTGRMAWPKRGVYFFMEDGERRSDTGIGGRVVRVGTHALKADSNTTLWRRLSQHKGQEKAGGGNHRGSIFRLIVGTALDNQQAQKYPTWGLGNNAPRETRDSEIDLERVVSEAIGRMPFLWLEIDDEPGATSERGYLERNSIALLSNYGKSPIDPASSDWLGHRCNRDRVRKSGLWNQNHVDETYDPAFLGIFDGLVGSRGPN